MPVKKKKYKAGDDIDSYCGRCKLVLAHVIHAMKTERAVGRCECKTCGALHAYRAKVPGTGRASAVKETPEEIFDKLIAGKDISSPIKYAFSEEFEADMMLDHKKFGLGLVTRDKGDSKIEVTFRDGVRVLIHKR